MPTAEWCWNSRASRPGLAACYIFQMNSTEALETLRRSEHALRGRGVKHVALFGSVARGENRSDSDIDIMIEFDPEARVTVFDYVDIKEYIAQLFDRPVDVVNREGLKPYVRPAVMADAIYAF
jgi:predicted nucleotidyltransferase